MKDKLKNNNLVVVLLISILPFVLTFCQPASEKKDQTQMMETKKKEQLYYCPMDTQIVRNAPGECPICGMDLELKPEPHQHNPYESVVSPVNASVLSNAKSIKPVRKSLPVVIKVLGKVEYDPERVYDVSSRTAGRIEKLYIKFAFQPVKKGEALFDIFSHDLLSAQKNYIYLKTNDPDASELIIAAEKKLQLLGMTSEQIKNLNSNHHNGVHPTTTVYSPYNGYIIEGKLNNKAIPNNNNGMSEGMQQTAMESAASDVNNNDLIIKEGAYVGKGEKVFKVVNTDKVWGVFDIYSNDFSLIKQKQSIKFILENSDDTLVGKVDFIEPVYNEELKTGKIRVYISNNNQKLKIGNILHGEINAGVKEGLWVPQTALLDLGQEKVVFVKEGQTYKAREVTIGTSSNGMTEIAEGLSENDEIAENAQYMVDSESFVKVDDTH